LVDPGESLAGPMREWGVLLGELDSNLEQLVVWFGRNRLIEGVDVPLLVHGDDGEDSWEVGPGSGYEAMAL
jgi:hypothetical protein